LSRLQLAPETGRSRSDNRALAAQDNPVMAPLVDAQAYLFVQGLLFIALPLTAWAFLSGRHDAATVAQWCVGGLIAGIGFVLIGLHGRVADVLSYPVATALAYGAYLLWGGALQHELGQRPRWVLLALICALATLGFQVSMNLGRDPRELYGAGIHLAGASWLACLSFTLGRREKTRSAVLLGTVFALSAVASTIRAAAVLDGWGAGRAPDGLVNATALLTALYANLAYVGLVLERSRAKEQARTEGHEREHALHLQTEQHALGLDVLRAERRDMLNESTPAMLHSIDANGHLLAVSDTWLSKLGYTRAEVIGRPSADFLTPPSREHARQVVLPEFFRVGRCDNVAYQMLRKDGSVLDVRLSAVLERDIQGGPLRSWAVIEDVTEKLVREAELAREQGLRLLLEQHAQKLDALLAERSEMLHVLAHEVRQPLQNASAALQSAASALGQTREPVAADRLWRAQAVLVEVLAGLNNTLAAAALLAGSSNATSEDIDIDAMIEIALGDIAQEDRARIQIEHATTTRTAAMDPSLMRLALRNLLDNALSYSPRGSAVVLRVSDSDQPLALIVDVIDGGAGIEADLRPRLFQRGERGALGASRPGSGLGLYIVRRVAEMHSGRIEAVPRLGGGTVMRLTIPQGLPPE